MSRRTGPPRPPAPTAPRPGPRAPELPPEGLTEAERLHFQLLDRWREAMDLVGPGPLAPHFLDAAAAVQGLQPGGRWADLGSGAGFPGIALAARHPAAQVLLIESRRKRALFLETVLDTAHRVGLLRNAIVVHGRSEDLAGPFDGLVSRAYKAPEGVLEDAELLLGPHGRVALMLGDSDWQAPDGWEVVERSRYAVPDGFRRVVVVGRG